MASSSRSIYRHFSTSIARAERPRGLQAIRPYLSNVMERETDAVSNAMKALTEPTAPTEEVGRKQIPAHAVSLFTGDTDQFLTPNQLSRESLYAPEPPRTRAPLLGPKTREARKIDPFHISRTSPLDYVFNPLMGQAFVNQVGWIRSRAETGLTWKSQRAVGKLVRRQRAMGIIGQWTGRSVAGGYGAWEKGY